MLIMLILSKAILPSTIFDNLDRNLHLHYLLFALHLQIAPCSFLWMNNARIVDFALKCDLAYLVWSTQMCSQFIGCGWKCWWFSGVCVYFATLCHSIGATIHISYQWKSWCFSSVCEYSGPPSIAPCCLLSLSFMLPLGQTRHTHTTIIINITVFILIISIHPFCRGCHS